MSGDERFDVIVLGSGFAGSLLATILSREGMSVATIDKARHPRFTIGESSTPAADLLLHDLATRHGLAELLPLTRFGSWRATCPQIACGCKRGFSYFWHGSGNDFRPTAEHDCELLVAASRSRDVADTQWYRPDVDEFLASVARRYGVATLEEAVVTGIEHLKANRWSITLEQSRRTRHLEADFIVDASGAAGALIGRLGIPDATDRLKTRSWSVYGHFDGVRPLAEWLADRDAASVDYPYPAEDSAVHHLFDNGWLWQLRFENRRTSLGFVFAGLPPATRTADAAELWASSVAKRPVLEELLGRPRIARPPGRLFRTGRLQRMFSTGAGDDWAAMPHTIGFIDPLHSTGIAHSLSGVERVSRILLGNRASEAFAGYSADVVEELAHIDRLVSGCYAGLADFRLFAAWSMLYFAAATTFELRRNESDAGEPGFLCADDAAFNGIVREQFERLSSLVTPSTPPGETEVDKFRDRLRDAIGPFNSVGLFEPAVPNMYRYTAATK